MTNTATQNIVHESEASRQYVRIPVPARAEINGKEFGVKDLSSGGVGLKGDVKEIEKGQTLRMTLILPFEDFSLDTYLEAQVQSVDSQSGTIGARFTNLTSSQISMLNHVIRAYMNGDMVSSGDILSVAGRNDFVRLRSQKDGGEAASLVKRNILPLALIGAVGMLALYTIVKNLYEGLYIVSSSNGVVVTDHIEVNSPSAGVFTNMLAEGTFNVAPETPLARLDAAGGFDMTSGTVLNSPCDCYVKPLIKQESTYVEAGTPLYQLTPVDAEPQIIVYIDPIDAQRLQINDGALLKIAGSNTDATGRVTDIQWQNEVVVQKDGNPVIATKVIIAPEQKLPLDFINRPASVDFQTF